MAVPNSTADDAILRYVNEVHVVLKHFRSAWQGNRKMQKNRVRNQIRAIVSETLAAKRASDAANNIPDPRKCVIFRRFLSLAANNARSGTPPSSFCRQCALHG